MVESKLRTAPHVTTVFEVDMSKVMAHWKANEEPFQKQGVRLTLTAYFVTAVVRAAQAQPILNSRWTEDGLFTPRAVNVGMAVALQEGLIVPVIKNAQDLSLAGIARQVGDLATRARRPGPESRRHDRRHDHADQSRRIGQPVRHAGDQPAGVGHRGRGRGAEARRRAGRDASPSPSGPCCTPR